MKNYPSVEAFKLFVHLMQTQSLSQSAANLNIPVSTASHLLSDLRVFFEDELFVRCRQGLLPTQKARDELPYVLTLMQSYSNLKAVRQFDPSAIEREVRIGCVDNAPVSIFPSLLEQISDQAPNLCLTVHPLDSNRYDMLRQNEVDLIISPMSSAPSENFHTLDLPEQRYCIVCCPDHPLLKAYRQTSEPVSTDEILKYRFVDVALSFRRYGSVLLRSVVFPEFAPAKSAIRSYFFLAFVRALNGTDLLMVMPDKSARLFELSGGLSILPTQAQSIVHKPKMIWHDITHADPEMQWIRAKIFASVTS